jgi:hypothetical protein
MRVALGGEKTLLLSLSLWGFCHFLFLFFYFNLIALYFLICPLFFYTSFVRAAHQFYFPANLLFFLFCFHMLHLLSHLKGKRVNQGDKRRQ